MMLLSLLPLLLALTVVPGVTCLHCRDGLQGDERGDRTATDSDGGTQNLRRVKNARQEELTLGKAIKEEIIEGNQQINSTPLTKMKVLQLLEGVSLLQRNHSSQDPRKAYHRA